MSRLFHVQFDEDALTDQLFEFVIDPHPSRNVRPVINEVHDMAPHMIPVLEMMVMEGVDNRDDVADFVHATLGTPVREE